MTTTTKSHMPTLRVAPGTRNVQGTPEWGFLVVPLGFGDCEEQDGGHNPLHGSDASFGSVHSLHGLPGPSATSEKAGRRRLPWMTGFGAFLQLTRPGVSYGYSVRSTSPLLRISRRRLRTLTAQQSRLILPMCRSWTRVASTSWYERTAVFSSTAARSGSPDFNPRSGASSRSPDSTSISTWADTAPGWRGRAAGRRGR